MKNNNLYCCKNNKKLKFTTAYNDRGGVVANTTVCWLIIKNRLSLSKIRRVSVESSCVKSPSYILTELSNFHIVCENDDPIELE